MADKHEEGYCAICFEYESLIEMPCCGSSGAPRSFCRGCLGEVCKGGGAAGKCPMCRAWVRMMMDSTVVLNPWAEAFFEGTVFEGSGADIECGEDWVKSLPTATACDPNDGEDRTCAICFENVFLVEMPCCGAHGAPRNFCRQCMKKVCKERTGGSTGKCPLCRAWVRLPPDGPAVLNPWAAEFFDGVVV